MFLNAFWIVIPSSEYGHGMRLRMLIESVSSPFHKHLSLWTSCRGGAKGGQGTVKRNGKESMLELFSDQF